VQRVEMNCMEAGLNRTHAPRQTLRILRACLLRVSLLLILLVACLGAGFGQSGAPGLELFPDHFTLRPGERIHYQVFEHFQNGRPREPSHYEFATADSKIVRLVEPTGLFEAGAVGRTDIVIRTPTTERRVRIEVAGTARPPISAVPQKSVQVIVGKKVLFVGHANLDGFDWTGVAKPGIDELVQEAKRNGWPVVYWVSQEYPDWYTADRHPNYAIISEGQEHQVPVEAQTVLFTGGDYMFCLLRNVQMTLHGMIQHNVARRIEFVLPTQAIWAADIWGPGDKRPYPAPMVLLSTLFARSASDSQAYDQVVVPFLNRVITDYPVEGYPSDAPAPPLSELLKDWNIVVRFAHRFEQFYRRVDSDKTLFVEFQGM
jgi:hypothetical protein